MMKKIYFLTVLLTFIGILVVKADTTDYYSISYNNVILGNYKGGTNDSIPLFFEKTSIKENDELTVKYMSDTLCGTCRYYLVIIDSEKHYVKVISNTGQGSPLTFSVSEVLNWSNEKFIDRFEIYYYPEKPAFPAHLFTMILK